MITDRVRHRWELLEASVNPSSGRFDARTLDPLPDPARRLLRRSLPAGAPLHHGVRLEMCGRIKLGTWVRYRAEQLLVSGVGFVWAPVVGPRFARIVGADSLTSTDARMEFRLFDRVPIVSATGPDVERSAAGRLAAETVAWLPSALTPQAGATWRAIDADRAAATLATPAGPIEVTVAVDAEGHLVDIDLDRWNSDLTPPALVPFGGVVTDWVDVGGVRIAGSGRVGWHHRTTDATPFFEYSITNATFLTGSNRP